MLKILTDEFKYTNLNDGRRDKLTKLTIDLFKATTVWDKEDALQGIREMITVSNCGPNLQASLFKICSIAKSIVSDT